MDLDVQVTAVEPSQMLLSPPPLGHSTSRVIISWVVDLASMVAAWSTYQIVVTSFVLRIMSLCAQRQFLPAASQPKYPYRIQKLQAPLRNAVQHVVAMYYQIFSCALALGPTDFIIKKAFSSSDLVGHGVAIGCPGLSMLKYFLE